MRKNCQMALLVFVVIILLLIANLAVYGLAKRVTIGLATKSSPNLFWPLLEEGAKDAAMDLDSRLIILGPPKANDIYGQLAVINKMLTQGIDALVVAPCDSTGIVTAINKARAKKIPVIAVDTAVIGAKVTSFIATNNVTAAEAAAEWIATQLKGAGRVIIFNGMQSQQTGKDRRDGFVNYLNKHYPGVKIIEIPTDYEPQKAKTEMNDLLERNLQFDAVFCTWDDATIAVFESLESFKYREKMILVGFDGTPNVLKLLKMGKVNADVAQFPYKMGYQAIKYAIYAAEGKQIPALIYTDSMVVTKENLYEFLKKAHITMDN